MKSWLFALGLALCCVVQANEKERFEDSDHSKIAGLWYLGAMATNCSDLKKVLPGMKVSVLLFENESAEKMSMITQIAMGQECKKMKVVLEKKNERFVTECGCGGKKIMEYIQMKKGSMFTSINVSGKEECKVVAHAEKNINNISENKEFGTFVKEVGLEEKDIRVLSTEGMCPHSS